MEKKTNNHKKRGNWHNNFAKKVFADPIHLLGLAKLCLPRYLAHRLTLDHIKLMPDTLIDNRLDEYVLDLMFEIKNVGDNIARYVIVEFKSTQDILSSPQVKTYAMGAMFKLARELRQQGDKPQNSQKPLPMIYPVILYSGQKPFRHPLDYLERIHGKKEDIDQYWRGKTCMVDLAALSDKQLSDTRYFPSNVPMLCLKHSRDTSMTDFLQNQPESDKITGQFRRYLEESSEEAVSSLLHYICDAGNIADEAEFANVLNKIKPDMKEVVMTLREKAFNEGEQTGFNRGKQIGFNQGEQATIRQSVLKMLAMGESTKKIMTIFGLSADEIRLLQKHMAQTDKA